MTTAMRHARPDDRSSRSRSARLAFARCNLGVSLPGRHSEKPVSRRFMSNVRHVPRHPARTPLSLFVPFVPFVPFVLFVPFLPVTRQARGDAGAPSHPGSRR
jgi:hypothetical protein